MRRLDDHGCPPRARRRPAPRRAGRPRCPTRDSTRASATSPGSSRPSAVRSARPATAGRRRQPAGIPVAVRQVAQPAIHSRRGDSTSPVRQHDAAPASPATAGRAPRRRAGRGARHRQLRRDRRQEGLLLVVERWLAGRAVDPDRAPRVAGPVAAPRSSPDRRPSPCSCATRARCGSPPVASCRVDTPALGARDVGDLVDVVLVVLVREHLRWELGQPVVVVARDQERRRVERVPARRDRSGERPRSSDLRALLPEGHQVDSSA